MELLFWTAMTLILYPYLGYPLLLLARRALGERPVRRAACTPEVTLIITAYNEARNIRAKLENALELDYPRERLQIIVASDCSDDGTDWIVRKYGDRGVELVATASRGGKVAAQNAAIARATGEILVFSDARVMLSRDSIRAMMENFADPEIGCVSSTDRVVSDKAREVRSDTATDSTAGEGHYVRYEMWLRQLESATGTLIGASGSFYAVRRSLAGRWDAKLTRDFLTPLKAIEAGYRAVPEPRAIGTYGVLDAPQAEFRRKERTVLRGMAVLFHMWRLLLPWRHPSAAWRLWSHKLLRWTVPFAILLLLVSSLVLAPFDRFYAGALVLELAVGVLALGGLLSRQLAAWPPCKFPLFFVNVNLSILLAWVRYLGGWRQITWEPTRH